MPDTPARPTLPQRIVLWILGALLFYIVALYPNVLMARFQPDDVVHYGFLKWLAVVLVLYWVAARLFFTERPVDTRPGRQTLAVTAAILLLVGIFSPIVSFSFVGDIDFFRSGYGDGYILLLMAASSLALAFTGRWKQVIVPALGSLAVVLWTFLGVQETISDARSGGSPTLAGNPHEGLAPATMASIQWEWGWILLFAGSGLLVYSAARRDEMTDAAPPFAAVPVDEEPEAAPAKVAAEAAAGAPAEPASAAAPAEQPAEEAAAEPAGEPATASAETAAVEAAPAGASAAEVEEGPAATGAAESGAEAAAEQPQEPSSESAAEAAEPEATEASAAEADAAAAETDTRAESGATPAAAATAEAESDAAEPAADEGASAAAETASAPESAGSDAQGPEGASSESEQASAAESGASDASASKPAGDAKNE